MVDERRLVRKIMVVGLRRCYWQFAKGSDDDGVDAEDDRVAKNERG